MNQLIAIDVVLLPPEHIMRRVISLHKSANPSTRLNMTDCLPHISLAMGVVDSTNLAGVLSGISLVADDCNALNLSMIGLKAQTAPDGRVINDIRIEKSKQLNSLYEGIKDRIGSQFKSKTVKTSMFVSPPDVADVSCAFVEGYYSGDFNPHITIGEGQVDSDRYDPIEFTAERLAVCHLGTYCTCRKVLGEVRLTS